MKRLTNTKPLTQTCATATDFNTIWSFPPQWSYESLTKYLGSQYMPFYTEWIYFYTAQMRGDKDWDQG